MDSAIKHRSTFFNTFDLHLQFSSKRKYNDTHKTLFQIKVTFIQNRYTACISIQHASSQEYFSSIYW